MEESLGSRRARALPRPDSSASSHNTRMTPSSSNSSTAHLPQRVQDLTARGVSGSLLQDRLRERKVESARQRRRSIDPSTERGVQSSPVKGSRDERRPSSSGIVAGKNMGVKQIEDAVSTLHKQNFDLKLELFHRRQRQETLEAKLEVAERKLEEQAELAEINDDLLAELEKRDQAVEEAVGIIVQLEEKVERLIQEREDVKAFDAAYEPGYFPSQDNDFSSSPPQFEKEAQSLPMPKKISRMPSFLSETTEGNEALRSLYLPYNGHSDGTLPKLPEASNDGMDSPRLSVLSESSFISVYGAKLPPLSLDEPEETPRRHRKSSSIEKWVDDRPTANAVVTPQKVIQSLRKSQFLSINDVLESPLQRLEKLKHTLERTERGLTSGKESTIKDRRRSREVREVSTEKKSFGRQNQHTLPPTPDTISTNTLRNYRISTETLSQNHMNNTFLNSTSTFPETAQVHHAFQPRLSIRPRSAGETVTSRREGHGWDTPNDDTTTDAGSASSTLSTYSAQLRNRRNQVVAPDLFSFSGGDWGRGYEPSLPAHTSAPTRSRYEALRRSSVIDDHPRSDDTVTNYRSHHETYDDDSPPHHLGYNQEYEYGTSPVDTTPKPDLPDRRSSLSAVIKLRKSHPNSNTNANTSSGSTTESPGSATKEKKSRIPNLRLFGRGESAPPPATTVFSGSPTKMSFNQGLPRPKAGPSRSSDYFTGAHTAGYGDADENGLERATPPPILRQRGDRWVRERPVSGVFGNSAGGGLARRGTSFVDQEESGIESGRARRGSVSAVMGGNGSGEMATRDEEASKGKKWFGMQMGRSGSVRRN